MKVLHVYRTYFPDPPGGLQEAIRQICFATRAFGIENTVFTLSPRPVPAVLDRTEARIVRRRSWMAPASCDLGGPAALSEFRRLARRSDLIHYLFPWPFADVLHATVAPRKPTVLTYISDIVRQRWLGALYASLMWRTLRSMSAIVANSPAYARTSPILSNADLRDRVSVIPLGIDESSYPSRVDDAVFDRLGLSPSDPFFLFIGVLRYYKGVHTLINAASKVPVPIVIAGSGPQEHAFRGQQERSGASNVLFAGQVSDEQKLALLRHCRALVLPSHLRSEAYGMVLVEASMLGKPMVSCEIGTGTSFVNQHEESGFVVPPEDVDALSQAMNSLLFDDGLARRFGNAARQRYDTLFSGRALGKAYSDLYREVVAKHATNRG